MATSTLGAEAVERAVADASRRAHADVLDFTVAPRLLTPAAPREAHDWLIEFADTPRAPDLFARALDEALCRLSAGYRAGRAVSGTIAPPRVVELPAGTFHRWRRRRAVLGKPVDVPRIAADRTVANGLLAVAGPMPLITVGPSA
jgi:hypothetical protein